MLTSRVTRLSPPISRTARNGTITQNASGTRWGRSRHSAPAATMAPDSASVTSTPVEFPANPGTSRLHAPVTEPPIMRKYATARDAATRSRAWMRGRTGARHTHDDRRPATEAEPYPADIGHRL